MAWWEWVPVVKTIGHMVDDPPGRETTDYSQCATSVAKCEGLGKVAAELDCSQCVDKMRKAYILDWLGVGNTGPELLEGAAAITALLVAKYGAGAVVKAGTGVGAVLLADDAVDVAVMLKKALDIYAASEEAKKALCPCGDHG